MTRSQSATSAGTVRSTIDWLRLYMFDVVTLILTSALALKFWWVYLGLQDTLLLAAAAVASLAEIVRRLIIARRHCHRPVTFFSDRRSDLVAGILLGTGPWPIIPVLVHSFAWPAFAGSTWFRLLGLGVALLVIGMRLRVVLQYSDDSRRTLLRDLNAVPDLHVASILVLS